MVHSLKLLLECPTIIAVIFVAGIGGTFQYGFCVSVMNSPSAYIKELVNRTCLQRYEVHLEQWQVSLIWSFTVSIFCVGGLLGSLSAGPLITRHGRKRCLLLNNSVALAGAILMILSSRATSFEMIMAGRFLYGINAGVSLSAHSLYLIECAPKRLRGMLGVTVSTFVALGKFIGQLLGISELLGSRQCWPWLLGFNGFTALLQLCTLPFLPESPRFLLLERGDQQACERALRRLWGSRDYRQDLEEMLQEKAAMQKVRSRSVLELLLDRAVRWQLLTIVVVFITLQLCGINAVYFYSFDIFRAAGIGEEQLSYTALGTGLCELTVSLCCCMMIETTGKKVLFLRGYTGMSASMVLLTATLYFQDRVSWMPYCCMGLVFMTISFFSSGPSGATTPIPGEILTQSYKSAGYTVACTLNWMSLFVVGMVFPILVEHLHSFCFLIFIFFCMSCSLFVRFNVPETKNRTTLEIGREFDKMHGRSANSPKAEDTVRVAEYETKF